MAANILIVEDENAILELIALNLHQYLSATILFFARESNMKRYPRNI